jgi:hypothetical protein
LHHVFKNPLLCDYTKLTAYENPLAFDPPAKLSVSPSQLIGWALGPEVAREFAIRKLDYYSGKAAKE